jgi:hypothetical protein
MEIFLKTENWHQAFTAFNGCIAMNSCIIISLAIAGFLIAILSRDRDPMKTDDTSGGALGSDQPNKDKTSQEETTGTCDLSERATGIATGASCTNPTKAPITDIREGRARLTAIGRKTEHPGWPDVDQPQMNTDEHR